MAASISGNCGCSFIIVNLSGDASAQTVSDNDGNFTFSGLADGNYTVTPDGDRVTSFTFTPTSQNVTLSGSDVTGVNFTCPSVNFTVKGNVGLFSKNIVYYLNLGTTVTRHTATADSDGNYAITIPTTSALNGVLMKLDNGNWV